MGGEGEGEAARAGLAGGASAARNRTGHNRPPFRFGGWIGRPQWRSGALEVCMLAAGCWLPAQATGLLRFCASGPLHPDPCRTGRIKNRT